MQPKDGSPKASTEYLTYLPRSNLKDKNTRPCNAHVWQGKFDGIGCTNTYSKVIMFFIRKYLKRTGVYKPHLNNI